MNEEEIYGNGVYMFHNRETGEAYIGSTNDLQGRAKAHLRNLQKGQHPNRRFQRAYDRNPNFDFVGTPLENRELAFDVEQAIIDEFCCSSLLLNSSKNARYCSFEGWNHTEEARRKISEAQLGRPGHWAGKTMSIEHRSNVSKGLMGHVVSDETREKIRLANTGKRHSPETLAKISANRTGIGHTEETRARMSAAHMGKPKSATHAENIRLAKQALARQVSCMGVVYAGVNEAARQLGLSPGTVHYRVGHPKHTEWFYL